MSVVPATTRLKVAAGIVAGMVVGAAVSGALASAAIPDADGTVHACVEYDDTVAVPPKKPSVRVGDGSVRIVDGPADCRSTETAIDWSRQGPTGPPGEIGPEGPEGPAGTAGDAWDAALTAAFFPIPSDGSRQVIGELELPPGDYSVIATVSGAVAASPGATFGVECELRPNGSQRVASQSGQAVSPADTHLTLVGVASLPEGGTIELGCTSRAASVVVEPDAIVATRVAAIH